MVTCLLLTSTLLQRSTILHIHVRTVHDYRFVPAANSKKTVKKKFTII